MDLYKLRQEGEIITQSNVLSSLVRIADGLARDEPASSEILDPSGRVIYAIKEKQTYIDRTADYPDLLPHPFKN